MTDLSRRQFFSFVARQGAARAQRALVSVARAARQLEPPPQGAARCARCNLPFDPGAAELLCPACRARDARQHALLAALFKHDHGQTEPTT